MIPPSDASGERHLLNSGNAPRFLSQDMQNLEFPRRKLDNSPGKSHAVFVWIDLQASYHEGHGGLRSGWLSLCAAKKRFDPR